MADASLNIAHLSALHTAQDIHDLFARLGYPVNPPDAFEGDDLDALELDPADRANVRRAYIVANPGSHAVYLYEVADVRAARLRSLAWNVLSGGRTGLLVVTTPAETGPYREVIFVDPRLAGRPVKSSVRANKLKLITAEPTRHDLDTLNAIHAHRRTPLQIYDAQAAAFNVATVTKRFYDEYRGHYERAKAAIQKANPGVRDFYDANKLHAYTQRLLGRMMFLYFLQRKGWLGGKPRFLTDQYRFMQQRHAGETGDAETYRYFAEVLEPLFFQTMNQKRPDNITRWEGIRIPYLNGGLFDEARDPAGPILIPDSLFDPNDVSGLLNFFNRYNFTVADDTPLEQDVAVDPEMLGKVFENLLEERDRGQSGSFYTPRPIVSYMCQEALAGYLEESAALPRETTRALFDPDSEAVLTPDEAERVNAALDTLTVLDPAVGSGSFLIGMMNEIMRLRKACYFALTPLTPSPSPTTSWGEGNAALASGSSHTTSWGEGNAALASGSSPTTSWGEGNAALTPKSPLPQHLEERGLQTHDHWHIPPDMRKRMTEIARMLRKNATASEDILWQALRNHRLDNRKFKRQVDIGAFVLDFYCPEERLAVEVDGSIHATQVEADRERQRLIESLGIRFVRVTADQVEQNLPETLSLIRAAFLPLASPAWERGQEGEGSIPSSLLSDWKEAIIRDTLYGVDIKPEAIEIAQLRLWLSLVVDQTLEQARPLPNLDYKLMAGNSLIETIDGEPVLGSLAETILHPAPDVKWENVNDQLRMFEPNAMQSKMLLFEDEKQVSKERIRLDELRREFFNATPERRRVLRSELQTQERRIVSASLHEKTGALQAQIDALGKKSGLGGLKAADERKLKAAADKLERLTDMQLDMGKPDYAPPFFLYHLHFSEVFERKGGFDIVVANPPYVRMEEIKEQKAEFELSYPEVYAGRADLFVYFYARGYQLLRLNGQFAYISSNKFMRAKYGEGLRGFLSSKMRLQALIDFGDLPVFDAAAYPVIVIAEKHVVRQVEVRAVAINDIILLENLPNITKNGHALSQSALGEAEWQFSDTATEKVLLKLRAEATPLGSFVNGAFYRGVVTGLNDAFVIDHETRQELVRSDEINNEIIKPFIVGRDVKRWAIDQSERYLIFTYHGIDIGRYPTIERYLLPFKQHLESRATSANHKWYELQQPQMGIYAEFSKPKIVYPHFNATLNFAFDVTGAYSNDKTYFIPSSSKFLLGILNSNCCHFFLKQLAPAVRGGYLEFRVVYVSQLPVPNPPANLRNQIAVLAQACLDAAKDHPDRLPALEAQLDTLVYQAYGLDEDDIAVIEGSVGKGKMAGDRGVLEGDEDTSENTK